MANADFGEMSTPREWRCVEMADRELPIHTNDALALVQGGVLKRSVVERLEREDHDPSVYMASGCSSGKRIGGGGGT